MERPNHTRDEQCDVDPETFECRDCGVYHGDPCACGGRGFHRDGCCFSDEAVSAPVWAAQEARIDAENAERDERDHRFREDVEPLDPEEARQNVIDAGGF